MDRYMDEGRRHLLQLPAGHREEERRKAFRLLDCLHVRGHRPRTSAGQRINDRGWVPQPPKGGAA